MQINSRIWSAVDLEIVSADPERFINSLMQMGIELSGIQQEDELTVRFTVALSNYRAVKNLSDKLQANLKIKKIAGLSKSISNVFKRPLLLIGVILFILVSVFIPRRILFIQVTGNASISANEIVEKAAVCGLTFGCSRKEVRSEQIKNHLLEEIPQLQWIGINTSGCVATISVKERSENELIQQQVGPVSIIASKDGIIRSATSTRGTLSCQVGQAVTEGQTLISAYTDCGLAIVLSRAEGEVFADTNNDIIIRTLKNSTKRGRLIGTQHRTSIIVGKKTINLCKDSGILDTTCVKIYEDYNVCLPGGFELPVKLQRTTIEYYECFEQINESRDYSWLVEQGEKYLISQMIAGKILDSQQQFVDDTFTCGYDLHFACSEMIGRIKKEEFFELHG